MCICKQVIKEIHFQSSRLIPAISTVHWVESEAGCDSLDIIEMANYSEINRDARDASGVVV